MLRKKRSRKGLKAAHGRWVPHAVLYAVLLIVTSALFLYTRSSHASDGSGTNTVAPTALSAGATGTAPIFTFTAGEVMDSGGVSIVVPVNSGWSAPQGTAGAAGYVTASSSAGMVATVINALDATTNWSAPTRMTLSADTGDKQEGTASLSNDITSAATAGDQWYLDYGAASDWGVPNSTTGTRVGFWIKSSVAAATGTYSWQDDDSASLGTPLDTQPVQSLAANTWTYASVNLGASRSSILSYGFRYTTDTGAVVVKADSMSMLFDAADVTTNWTADTNITVSYLNTSGNYKEGIGAIRCTYAAAAGVGGSGECYRQSTTNVTMGPGTVVSFWVRSSVGLSAGDFAWVDDGSSNLASAEDTVSLPALATSTWTYVTLTAANSANKNNRSYGLRQINDKGALTIDIDAMGKQIDAGDSTTGWSPAGTAQTLSADTTTFHEGAASLKNVITASAVAGDSWYETFGAAQNWSGYTTVGFWIRSSVGTAAGNLKFDYATTTDLSSPIGSLSIPALTANTWTYVTTTLSGTRTSVKTFGIDYATDIGAATINLDDILIGPGVPTFSGGDTINIRLLTLGNGQTARIAYGSGDGASGATAPTTTGVYTFTTKSLVSDSGTLTTILAASPTITVGPAATSQFLINDPGNMTAGTRLGYTLTRKDQYGNLVTSGAQTVYLYSSSTGANRAFYNVSSGGSPVTLVTFADGTSTAQFWYYDDLASSFTLRASDNATSPDGTTGIDDATDSVTVSADATSQFTLNDPGNMTAGTRLGYVVTRKDQFGNAITTGSDTVRLTSDSTGNKAFYAASSGGSPITSVDIGAGTSTVQFWYYDDKAGSITVTAYDNISGPDGTTGVDDATDGVTVSAAAISQFTLNDPGNMVAGTRLGYIATRKDAFGNIVTTGSNTVYFYSSSTGAKAFYAASSGGSPISSLAIGSGTSTVNFWYYDDQPGTWTITASDNSSAPDGLAGVDDATDSVTVNAATTSQFTLNDPGNMTAGTRIGYVVTRKDFLDNPVTAGSDRVYLTSNSTGNKVFYDAPTGGNATTSVTIVAGTSTAQFWYYDDKIGSFTVTAYDNIFGPDGATGIADATDSVTVSAASTDAFFLTDPGDMIAGDRLGYTITRKDVYGNVVTAGSDTVRLYSSSTGNKAFYNVSSGGSPITSIAIGAGTSTARVWYYDDLVGTWLITASDNASGPDGTAGIDDATDNVAVSADVTSAFFLTDPGDMTAGTRKGYTVTRKDSFGNLVTSGSDTVYLFSDSTGNKAFYASDSGGSPMTQVTIGPGASTANFWYYDDKVGSWTVTAYDTISGPDGTTGVDDATDGIAVSADVISQFTLNNPGNMTAGTRLGYTVTRKDQFGNAITTGSDTVYFSSDSTGNKAFYAASSGGSPITSVDIGAGTSTAHIWYYDDTVGSYTVTAYDNILGPDGTTGIDDDTDGVTVSAAAVSQFLLNDPGNMVAGDRLGYTVTRKDAFGNIVTTGSNTVHLYSSSTGGVAFYTTSSGGAPVSSITIGSGASTANFWYYDDLPGTWTITVSDNASSPDGTAGIDDAADSVTVNPAPTSQFTLNNPGNMTAGTRLGYVVTRKDFLGNGVTAGSDTVYLHSDSTGNKAFYDAPSGGTLLTSLVIGVGTSTAQFWYYDNKSGSITITAYDNIFGPDGTTGIDDATDAVTISPDVTSAFFLTDPGDMTAGNRLGYTITRKDQYGNAVTTGSDTVYLYSDSSGNKAFYTVPSGGSPVPSITIGAGTSTDQVWYYDDKVGSITLAASDNATGTDGMTGIDDATDSVTVSAAATHVYLLNEPGDMTAGQRLGYIVTRKDQFGNVVTGSSETVYIFSDSTGNKAFYASDSGGSPMSQVTIGAGASTANFWYYDDKVGSWTVTAYDTISGPDGTTGVDDATDGVTVSADAVSQFTLNNPGNMTAGTRLGYTVTRKDQFGNLISSGSQTVYLHSDSTGNKAFYAASSGGPSVGSVTFAGGSSTAEFWYYDDKAGSFTVTAYDNILGPDGTTGIDDATDGVTVSPDATAAFFLTDPGDVSAGIRLGYVVTRKDQFGNAVTSGSDTVRLFSDSSGNKAFYAAEIGGSPMNSVTIGAGTSTANFWYYDDQVGSVTMTAYDNISGPDGTTGIDDATDALTILPASTSEFLLSEPGDMTAGTRLGYTVTRKDPFGNAVTTGSDVVRLMSDSTGNKAFYDAPSGGTLITSLTIGAGTSTAQFWYYDNKAGSITITAYDNILGPDGTTGIDDATDGAAISAAAASQFVIIDPADSTVGSTVTVTVKAEDPYGNLVSSYQNDVTLNASGSSTGAGLVDIANGVGTKDIGDHLAETVHLTLSDTQSTNLSVGSSQDVVFAAGETRQYGLNDPGNMTAGTRLGYTVTRRDQYGNAATAGSETVYLYSDSTGNKAFYAASTGGVPTASVTIGPGASTANFWYYDDKAGTFTVKASDSTPLPDDLTGIDDATDSVTVTGDVAAAFLLNDPGNMTAGERIEYTVTRKDQFGNVAAVGSNTVYLFGDSTGNKKFYGSATSSLSMSSVEIGPGASTANFWYYDDKAGSFTVTASDNASGSDGSAGINDGSDDVAVSAAAVSQFVLDDPGDMTVFTRVGYTVTRKDAFGNLVTAGTDTVRLHSNSSGTSTAFYAAASGGLPMSSVDINGGSSSALFWYYDGASGPWLITAYDNVSGPDGLTGIDDGTDTITVTALPIVASRYVIVDPTDSVAGTAVPVTVRAEDPYGSVDTTIQTDVTLNVSGSATGGGVVNIVDGVGTIDVNDGIAETVNLSLFDSQSSGLNVSSTQTLAFATGPTAKFTLNDPGDTAAGNVLRYTISREDAHSNLVTSGSDIAYLYSSGVAGTHRFYDAASGGSIITSIEIGAGHSSVDVWYSDDHAATVTVTAYDNILGPNGTTGIDDATDSVIVSPTDIKALQLSDPGDMTIGTRIGYSVTRVDPYGNLVVSGSEDAQLFAQPAGTSTAFYDVASGGSPITVLTIPEGRSQGLFWFYTNEAGSVDVVARSTRPGVTQGSDSVLASANAITATKFIVIDPADGQVGDDIVVTVKAVNDAGSVDTSYQNDVRLNVSGHATGGGLVNIVNGIGTKTITDDVAESVHLTLTDTQSTGLNVASSKYVVFSSLPPQVSHGGAAPEPVVNAIPLSQLTFEGSAYPGGKISVSVRQGGANISLKQDANIESDGHFSTSFPGSFGGGKVYGILATDKDGRPSPVQSVTINEAGNQVVRSLVMPPTIGFARTTVLKGDNLTVIGYAPPGSTVEASVDGTALSSNTVVAADSGSYKISVPTVDLEYGSHIVRTREALAGGGVSGNSLQKTFMVSRLLNPVTDLNGDGRVNVSDWSIFLTRWNSTDADLRKQIDLNGDGKTDVADFSIFIRSLKTRL